MSIQRRRLFIGAVSFVGLLLMCLEAFATSFMARPMSEVVKDAAIIVRGRVGMSYADTVNKRIHTFIELAVDETFKGAVAGRSLMMRQLGGTKDGTTLAIDGSARFERGEDVLVLLSDRNSDGSHDVRGLMMAKFTIVRDEQGREILAGPALLHGGAGDGHIHQNSEGVVAQPVPEKWTLEALRRLIASQDSGGVAGVHSPRVVATPDSTHSPHRASPPASNETLSDPAQSPDSASGQKGGAPWSILIGGLLFAFVFAWLLLRKR